MKNGQIDRKGWKGNERKSARYLKNLTARHARRVVKKDVEANTKGYKGWAD